MKAYQPIEAKNAIWSYKLSWKSFVSEYKLKLTSKTSLFPQSCITCVLCFIQCWFFSPVNTFTVLFIFSIFFIKWNNGLSEQNWVISLTINENEKKLFFFRKINSHKFYVRHIFFCLLLAICTIDDNFLIFLLSLFFWKAKTFYYIIKIYFFFEENMCRVRIS